MVSLFLYYMDPFLFRNHSRFERSALSSKLLLLSMNVLVLLGVLPVRLENLPRRVIMAPSKAAFIMAENNW